MIGNTPPTRGFVTIATGHKSYYVLARNLLLSYRLHNPESLPFAIICDRENEVTAMFDDVVVMDSPSFSFHDKLRLADLTPYDETIFIDADSLVCRNLDPLWGIAEKCPDFGIFGAVWDPDSEEGQKELERAGKLRGKMHAPCTCQGGMYFVRKSPALAPFMDLCMYIWDNFDEFRGYCNTPTDDNIIPIACSVFGYLPSEDWWRIFCFLPESEIRSLDIVGGDVSYLCKFMDLKPGPDCYFVHFSTRLTKELPYRREVYRLLCKVRGRQPSHLAEGLIRMGCSVRKHYGDILCQVKRFVYKCLHP